MAAHRDLIALALVGATALASLGCQPTQRVPPVIVGPMRSAPSRASFDRLVDSVRATGMQVEDAEPTLGRFRVASRYADRATRAGEHAFVVQLFQTGHVQVIPVGPRVQHEGVEYLMPPGLRRELVTLSQVLSRVTER